MSIRLNPESYTKYQALVAEKDRLKRLLDEHKNVKRGGNWKAVRRQYELKVKEIKQLYKTHA